MPYLMMKLSQKWMTKNNPKRGSASLLITLGIKKETEEGKSAHSYFILVE